MSGTQEYVGMSVVASLLGVSRQHVAKLYERYRDDPDHPFPAPEAVTVSQGKRVPGWSASSVDAVVCWYREYRKGGGDA